MSTITELSVCTDCLMISANGETTPPFSYETWESDIMHKWGEIPQLVPEGLELGFSWQPCQYCGNSLGGSRYTAYLHE